MTKFEKTIIPLVSNDIRPADLTGNAGFIDSFISDPDRPSGEKELFLVYNDNYRSEYTQDRARRFAFSKDVKRTYIKYVNGIPYYVYSFWIRPTVKKMYDGVIILSTEQKQKIINFWSVFDDISTTILNQQCLTFSIEHKMPLADYNGPSMYDWYIQNEKEGTSLNEMLPLCFLSI